MSDTTTTTRGGDPGAPDDPWAAAWRELVFLKQRIRSIEDDVASAVASADPDPAAELRCAGRHVAETSSLLRQAEYELRSGWAAVVAQAELKTGRALAAAVEGTRG